MSSSTTRRMCGNAPTILLAAVDDAERNEMTAFGLLEEESDVGRPLSGNAEWKRQLSLMGQRCSSASLFLSCA